MIVTDKTGRVLFTASDEAARLAFGRMLEGLAPTEHWVTTAEYLGAAIARSERTRAPLVVKLFKYWRIADE